MSVVDAVNGACVALEELFTVLFMIGGVLDGVEPGDTEEIMSLTMPPTASKNEPSDLVLGADSLTALNVGLAGLMTVDADDEDDDDEEDQNHHWVLVEELDVVVVVVLGGRVPAFMPAKNNARHRISILRRDQMYQEQEER